MIKGKPYWTYPADRHCAHMTRCIHDHIHAANRELSKIWHIIYVHDDTRYVIATLAKNLKEVLDGGYIPRFPSNLRVKLDICLGTQVHAQIVNGRITKIAKSLKDYAINYSS